MANITISGLAGKSAVSTDEIEVQATAGGASNKVTLASAVQAVLTAGTTADATINGLTVGRGGGNVSSNTAIGGSALISNSVGSSNFAGGLNSLYNATGDHNVAAGRTSLFATTSGNQNTGFGSQAGWGAAGVNANTTGSNNVYLGYATVGSANNNTNETVIGANAVGNGSNTVTIGDGNVVNTYLRGTTTIAVGSAGLVNIGGNASYQGQLRFDSNGSTVLSLDNTYDSAAATTIFRFRNTGTPVTALSLFGNGSVTVGAGGLKFPTSDPGISGAWWDNAGVLTKSP